MLSYILAAVAAFIALNAVFRSGNNPTDPSFSPRPQLDESLLAIDHPNATAPACPPDTYTARILSRQPLVLYLENFLSEQERAHLLEISDPIWEPSRIGSVDQQEDKSIRDSHIAVIPRTDTTRCIERRAHALQGHRQDLFIERLRTQRYDAPTGHYTHHYDWSAPTSGWGRVSSFMVWVDASGDIEGGGTEFPYLQARWEEGAWCEYLECENGREGTTFRVKPGNAVYWENFAGDGRGWEETWHAGLPVSKGQKTVKGAPVSMVFAFANPTTPDEDLSFNGRNYLVSSGKLLDNPLIDGLTQGKDIVKV